MSMIGLIANGIDKAKRYNEKRTGITHLNLSDVTLLGWEEEKSIQAIDSIKRGIKAGDKFPAVPVERIDEITYQLAPFANEKRGKNHYSVGGHTRSLAHLTTNTPLRVKIVKRPSARNYDCDLDFFPINQMQIVDDPEYLDRKKQIFEGYR